MAKRNRGEGSIYYSKARKQWIGQFTKTIAGEKIRKSVYGTTKNEVSEKLLDLRVEMKDADFIKEQKELSDYLFRSSIKDEKYKNVFLIQMYLGLRIGETLALTKNDIDLS